MGLGDTVELPVRLLPSRRGEDCPDVGDHLTTGFLARNVGSGIALQMDPATLPGDAWKGGLTGLAKALVVVAHDVLEAPTSPRSFKELWSALQWTSASESYTLAPKIERRPS